MPPEPKGALKVVYVRMSPTSQKVQWNELYQFDYGLVNEGSEPATDWWMDRVIFDPGGREVSNQGTTLDPIQPGKQADRCWLSDGGAGIPGRWRIHVRFYNKNETLHEADLSFEVTGADGGS